MFCLRSWIPILFFLSNASPMFLLLFLTGNYFLHRPCVYCSMLLGILVLALFDFRKNWFDSPESPVSDEASSTYQSISIPDVLRDTGTLLTAVFNATVKTLLHTITGDDAAMVPRPRWDNLSGLGLVELFKGRRELRIACMNAVLRL